MNLPFDLKLENFQHFTELEELLKVTVGVTQKTLRCDRVFVYDATELPKAKVVAEALDSKYVSIMDKTIIDPFLGGEYLELYCYGQSLALENINSAEINPSLLKELEWLEVKSLAIAPILANNKLFGFLVAHQCQQFQSWHSEAIKYLTMKANAVGFALSGITNGNGSNGSSFNNSSQNGKSAEQQVNLQPSNPEMTEQQENGNGKKKIDSTLEQKTIIPGDEDKFTRVNAKIAEESGRENILNTAVNESRHLLQCDRVVVYSLNDSNYGVIVAESIASGWTKARGKVIDDPCFAARYIEKYTEGRIGVWDDIYKDNTTSCYLGQLEALEVKASLVAPIIQENQLFGLLIAHQCSGTRNWQEQEINWITEIANQIGIMLDFSKILNETSQEEQKMLAASENKWNEHFTDAIQYIRQSITKEDILKASVKEVRRVLNCDRVVVYSLNENGYGAIVSESVAAGWTKAKGRVIKDPCFEAKYIDKYRNGRVRAWNDIHESGLTQCYIEQLEELEIKANLVAPIINEGKLFGLLVAHQCADTRNWQEPEIRWIAQIATQVGFALDNAQLLVNAKQLQHQLANEAKLTKCYTDAVRYIRESLDREDILEISVEEVRRVLNCDRVVVYSMNDHNHGTIVAESVAPGWTRAQGTVIKDPCFESRYLDKYRNGRVRAWDNIYKAGMTQCYIDQLEKLEVKANLVTPIISEGKLFGLLVAHQCSDFRAWQQPEIRWTTQIATQVGFALDNAQLLVDAKQLRQQVKDESRWTDYFTDATQQIRQSLKTGDILKTSVREVRRILECDRVVVYSMNSNDRGTIVAESVAAGWTRSLGRVIDDPCFQARYIDKYRNGRVRAWENIYESGMTQCYIDQLEKLEVKANLVTPIINENKLFGLLVAHQCSDFRTWQQPEIRWVTQIATQVGFALDNAKLLEQLQESNQTNTQISHQQQEQTEILKHQVIEILSDNSDAYQTLSREAMRQSETTIDVLHQIQQVADSFNSIALNVQQVKFQEQQKDLAFQDTQSSLENAVDSISHLQRTVQNITLGFDNLGDSSQKLATTVNTIQDLSKQIVKQSMSMTRAVSRSQIDTESRDSIMDLSDTIFALMQQLFEASAKIEPLFANIQMEVREKTNTLDSETQKLMGGVGEFQAVRQKLARVVALNSKMSNLIEIITQLLEDQTESSKFAKNSVQEVASIAERISTQSMNITQSFNQLVVLVQKL